MTSQQDKAISEIKSRAIELMSDWPSSRQRQKAFVLAYMANGFTNATQAAVEAGFSEKTARKQANNMLTNMDNYGHISLIIGELRAAFDERMAELSLMNAIEIQQFWARVVRGEELDQRVVGLGDGAQEIIEAPPDLSVRLNASDKYAKSLGMYQQNVNATITGDITFEVGAWDDDDG